MSIIKPCTVHIIDQHFICPSCLCSGPDPLPNEWNFPYATFYEMSDTSAAQKKNGLKHCTDYTCTLQTPAYNATDSEHLYGLVIS